MSRPPPSMNERTPSEGDLTPWWRFGMVWFILSGPAVVVVAGFATLAICLRYPDVELHEPAVAAVTSKSANPTSRAATWQAGDAATISGH